jgi:phage gp46-like protein
MPSFAEDVPIVIDGVESSLLAITDPLARAVVISLFTWKRARPDDETDADLWGWWGDNVSDIENDQIGSWLWLLARTVLTQDTLNRTETYATDALQHLLDDLVATRITAVAARVGTNEMSLTVTIYRVDAAPLTLRFSNVWSLINV